MPLIPDRVYLHTRPTVNSSTWLASAPKTKSKLHLCVTCSSLTIVPSQRLSRQHCMQRLITKLASACINVGLKISLKKTNVSAQDVSHAPEIKISYHTLVVVDEFTYLDSIISMNSGLDSESPEESANTPAGMSKLTNRAWENI